jgi:hypothetical protein
MLKITDLPKSTQDEFERITSMSANALSKDDIRFLKARRSYLTSDMLKMYGELLKEEPKIQDKKKK